MKNSAFQKAYKYLTDSDYRWAVNRLQGKYDTWPDERYLRRLYKVLMGQELNLEDPVTFNEKLQWLKLHDRNPDYPMMVDKYAAKEYVRNIIGEKYIIPTLCKWDSADDISFEKLPKRFVLKCTHDSHTVFICTDKSKADLPAIREYFRKALLTSYYLRFREWPYKNVKPAVIAEQYIDNHGEPLIDYKIHNFGGEPKVILVCSGRFSGREMTEDFYDCDWNRLDVKRAGQPNAKEPEEKPEKLPEMLELSKKLSKDIPFVRTDFYIADGKVLFGELTFFPTSGFKKFEPESFDKEMGDWLVLKPKKKEDC